MFNFILVGIFLLLIRSLCSDFPSCFLLFVLPICPADFSWFLKCLFWLVVHFWICYYSCRFFSSCCICVFLFLFSLDSSELVASLRFVFVFALFSICFLVLVFFVWRSCCCLFFVFLFLCGSFWYLDFFKHTARIGISTIFVTLWNDINKEKFSQNPGQIKILAKFECNFWWATWPRF